jgi:hypothetical protein
LLIPILTFVPTRQEETMSSSGLMMALACAALVGAATAAHAANNDRIPPDVQASLLTWAASDFAAQGHKLDKVRNVHVRYAEQDTGERTYLLCGEFMPANPASTGWTHFATIKTSPYEQWIGGMAEVQCERALPAGEGDLSSALQARLDAHAPSTGRP